MRGNLTGDEREREYSYDLYNRLTGAVVGGVPIIYDYDVAGRRVGKSVDGEETRFLHAGEWTSYRHSHSYFVGQAEDSVS